VSVDSVYQSDGITIYNGDCLEVMQSLGKDTADVVVTSPPYNKQRARGGLVKEVTYQNNDDNMDEAEYQSWQVAVLNECFRVSKSAFYNHKIRYQQNAAIHPMEWLVQTNWTLHQELIWNRSITGNLRGWRCWNIDERIYWLTKTKPKELEQRLAQLTSIWAIRPVQSSTHPAPFPLELATRCVEMGSEVGGVVLDPYMGSGTSLVAAKLLGRRAIGIDSSESYCEMAIRRLAALDGKEVYGIGSNKDSQMPIWKKEGK
jgi:modification methylase